MMRDRHADDAAAYALGALEEPEARAFEEHLAGCAECRGELAALRPVVATLPAATEPVRPPPELKARIMRTVESEAALLHAAGPEADAPAAPARSGRRWFPLRPLPALAAACVLLLAGAGIGVAVLEDDARTLRGDVQVAGAEAELRVRDGRGTLVVEGMPRPPRGRIYQVWLQRGSGPPAPTRALFTVGPDGRGEVGVPGDVEDVDAVLVTREPDGGSQTPSEPPMIAVDTA